MSMKSAWGVVLSLTLATGALAADEAAPLSADQPTTAELRDQIKQLQAKVEQLEAKQTQTSADVAATVNQIVEDANKRSAMLQTSGDFLAGHDGKGFFIKSADGNYGLFPSLELQPRSVTNYNSATDSTEHGFEIRRAKIRLEGNAINPDLTFAFQWAFNQSSGTPALEDAWVKYQWTPGWYVIGGQFKDFLLHEQMVSGRKQLAADRALMTIALTQVAENFTQGVGVIYDRPDQPFRVMGAFTDGINTNNTNWRDFPTNSTDFGGVGRVEYFAMGDRKAYDDFTALNLKKDLLVIGAAGDVTQAGSDTQYLHTVDAQWKNTKGFSVYSAYVGQYLDLSGGNAYNWGFEIEGAYLFRPNWEAFLRYDFVKFENDVTFANGASEDLFNEFTIGINRYIKSYYAKFTLDFTYLPNGCPSDQIGLGELAGDDAQYLLRGQFQLVL